MKGDKIPGGKGDKAKPSDFDPAQLRMGIAVEMEHTKSRRLAREIAMDHLSEDPRYYTKLKKVHKESMQQVEELLQLMHEVREHLSEAAPPPFKAADRAKQGMAPLPAPKLKGRSGATPPPVPKPKGDPKKHGEVLYHRTDSQGQRRAGVDVTPKSFGTKDLGIKRGWAGAADNPAAKFVARRAAKGESLSDTAGEIRNLIGEAKMPTNSIKMRKPRKLILRPKPLVRPGSKLKLGTSAGPAM
jgi:hypothetical protein